MNPNVMTCSHCGKEADIKSNSRAWDGWQGRMNALLTAWEHICPDCQKQEVIKDAAERA